MPSWWFVCTTYHWGQAPNHWIYREMLLAVNLHLQVNLARTHISRLHLEHQRIVVLLLLHHRFTQPSQSIPQMVYRFFNGFCLHLYQVDVLRVSGLRLQIQLMVS